MVKLARLGLLALSFGFECLGQGLVQGEDCCVLIPQTGSLANARQLKSCPGRSPAAGGCQCHCRFSEN